MIKHIIWLMLLIVIGLSLGACTDQMPPPTPTMAPSKTPSPIASRTFAPTDSPESTATLQPTATTTPTPEPILELDKRIEVPAGGFLYYSIKGYETEADGAGMGVFDPEKNIIISIYGVTDFDGNQKPEEIIDEFLGELEGRGYAEFVKGEVYTTTVNTVDGIAFDLTGKLRDDAIEGQTILVMPSENQYLFGLAIANVEADRMKWENEGKKVFSTLLESVEFIEGEVSSGSACPVSSDKTYGYSKDNPIKVGGDWLDGPARERAYLDSLSGPNGESIRYERTGSFNHGNTILDEYLVSYQGAPGPATIYLDEYSYAELMAPVGFRCWTPIPLTAP